MKIGKIRAACKAVQKCQLLTDERARRQWIGNGYAYYPVEGMWIEADELPAIMDIPPLKWEEWDTREIRRVERDTGTIFDLLEDTYPGELMAKPGVITVTMGGTEYMPFEVSPGRIVWTEAGAFTPIRGKEDMTPRYTLREAEGGTMAIAYMPNLLCRGIVTAWAGNYMEEQLRWALGMAPKE